jgi:hypothetical protein
MKSAVACAGLLLGGLAILLPTTAPHAQNVDGTVGSNDESFVSCLASESNLGKFFTPEKTWAFFLQSLRAGDRKAALSALLAGDLKQGFSSLVNAMSAEKMRAMAESFGPLTHKSDMGNITEYLVVRTMGTGSTGTLVQFEYHAACGGWRLVAM